MKYLEITLLIFAYTVLIVTLFIELVCYKKNIEKWETIALTTSLLFLILSLTFSSFFENSYSNESTSVFTLLSMTLVALTTPLNVLEERRHKIKPIWKKLVIIISAILFLITCVAYGLNSLAFIEPVIGIYLVISVILSMLLIRTTKPNDSVKHREKTDRIFAIVFGVLIPLSFLGNYAFSNSDYDMKIGFTLPLVFIFLAGSKLADDIQRLSLFEPSRTDKSQHFKNYSISEREKDVALLLIQGKTYKQISEDLHISIPTVKTHTSTIYKKCVVKNRTELAALLLS